MLHKHDNVIISEPACKKSQCVTLHEMCCHEMEYYIKTLKTYNRCFCFVSYWHVCICCLQYALQPLDTKSEVLELEKAR